MVDNNANANAGRRGSGLRRQDSSHISIPAVPASFDSLGGMNDEALQNLLSDDDAFASWLEKQGAVQFLTEMRDEMIAGNAKLAQETLSKEEGLRGLHAETLALRDTLADRVASFQALRRRQSLIADATSPAAIATVVEQARDEAEEESEGLVSSMMDGDLSVEDFCKQFVASRRLFHTRNAAAKCLRRDMTASASSTPRNSSAHAQIPVAAAVSRNF